MWGTRAHRYMGVKPAEFGQSLDDGYRGRRRLWRIFNGNGYSNKRIFAGPDGMRNILNCSVIVNGLLEVYQLWPRKVYQSNGQKTAILGI